MADHQDLEAFLRVVQAGGFRQAARKANVSASSVSEAIRRLERGLGVRLLNRTTRSVYPTQAGRELFARLAPAMAEVAAAVDAVNSHRDTPAGALRLNVPSVAARLILPDILAPFIAHYPEIRVEVVVEDGYVDILAAQCDAGIRYDERLEPDMIAIPIGPRRQRFVTAASPDYLARHGRPDHPRDLLQHACLRGQFASGNMPVWEFERDGEIVRVDPPYPLLVRLGAAADLAVECAAKGMGIVQLFEGWLSAHIEAGRLVPILREWEQEFSGPFLYFPGRRYVPAPLRALIDFVRTHAHATG